MEITEFNVGPDIVRVGDRIVTVLAMRPMADWTVREFCRVPIFFRDHKFYLKRKTAGPTPYAFTYDLEPWFPELGLESPLKIFYDEEYVAERDRDSRRSRQHDHLHSVLFSFYPFLGFFWSGFKERVLGPIGFEAVDITEASIMIEFGAFLLEAVFRFYFHSGFIGVMFSERLLFWLDWVLLLGLPLDCGIRYGRIIRGDHFPVGLFEWLFRRDTGQR